MGAGASAAAGLDAVIDALDRRLGEVGRRDHRFAWLRDEDGALIPIAAYYPGRKLIVLGGPIGEADGYRATAAGRGLELVVIAEDASGDDAAGIAEHIAAAAPARAVRSTAETHTDIRRAEPAGARTAPPPTPAERRASQSEAQGFWLGLVLLAVVAVECYVGFVVIGLDAGDLILGFGFVLDAGARVAGMVAAVVSGDSDGAWGRVLAGSPALWGMSDEQAARSRVATVSRAIAWLAGGIGLLGLVIAIL